MKLSIERSALLKAVNAVRGSVERKATIPILANVLLAASGEQLSITGTDLDIECRTVAPAEVSKPGQITVACEILRDIASKVGASDKISMEVEKGGDTLIVKSGRSRFKLNTIPATDFPSLNVGKFDATFVITSDHLTGLFSKTEFAISDEATRYYLCGTYLHPIARDNASVLRACATDGHRLAMIDVDGPEGSHAMPGVIVPRRTVTQVIALCDTADSVTVEVSTSKITFETETTKLTSKLIDGQFPDYMRVVPLGNDKPLSVARQDFVDAIARVSAIKTERSPAMKLSMGDGAVVLSMANSDTGTSSDELDAEYVSDPMEIGFNSRYLAEICSEIDADRIELKLADPGSPTIIAPVGDSGATYVLMPMRV
jgi:DNA polymerase-3 subunit beta